jgi:hypothetical protein
MVDLLVYIRSTGGTLTLIGAHTDLWNREISPMALSREPTIDEMAVVLQAAAKC